MIALGLIGAAVLMVGLVQGESSEQAAPADVPRGFFGVVPQGPLTGDDYERMGQGKVGILRTLLGWPSVAPSPDGDYAWQSIDRIVGGAATQGIRVLPFIYGTPEWVAELDGSDCEGGECGTYAPRSEEALAEWGEFVGAVVDRYGRGGEFWAENPELERMPIRAWQIWNEQNSPSFYQPEPDVAAYARLLRVAADEIRARDEKAEVILGGMFGTPLNGERPAYAAWDYIEELYEVDGIAERVDGIGAHPYGAKIDKVTSQLELFHEAIEATGDDPGIWITEIGWASGGEQNPLNRGPDGQAEQLSEAFQLFVDRRREWNINAVTWFSWRDLELEGICVWCPDAGLFEEEELAPKPSWEAFTAFTGGQ